MNAAETHLGRGNPGGAGGTDAGGGARDASAGRSRGRRAAMLVLLSVDAVLLAVLELFFLPLRLDGLVLPRLGDVPFPVAVVVAAVTTPWLVSVASGLGNRRLGMVPLLVWLVTMLVVGVAGPGGDLVLVGDVRTLLLLICGALPGALVLGGRLGRATRDSRTGARPAASGGASSGTASSGRASAKPAPAPRNTTRNNARG